MPRGRPPKRDTRAIARERIGRLWELAVRTARKNPERAARYAELARRVSRGVRRRLPLHMARNICRGCGRLLIPGGNCRVRIRHNRQRHVTVTCLHCGAIRRFPVTREG